MNQNEIEILNKNIGGMTLREASTFSFLQWVGNKINGVPAFTVEAVELSMLVNNPPMSRKMSDDQKLQIINKLLKLNVKI